MSLLESQQKQTKFALLKDDESLCDVIFKIGKALFAVYEMNKNQMIIAIIKQL